MTSAVVPKEHDLAGITVYRPDMPLLSALIDTLIEDGLDIVLNVDGPVGEAIDAPGLSALGARASVRIVQSAVNLGVAHGLNRLADVARAGGYRRIVYFDQDSSPANGLVAGLVTAAAQLETAGVRVAVIGPRPVAPSGESTASPFYGRRKQGRRGAAGSRTAEWPAGLAPADFVITSGSLVALDALSAVGPFCEAYRIDAIDTEWCFRARSKGFAVVLAENLVMPHRVGRGTIALGPIAFPRQSVERMASYLRNQADGQRLAHFPLRWKLRTLLYLPLQAIAYVAAMPDRRRTSMRLCRALADGFGGGWKRRPVDAEERD